MTDPNCEVNIESITLERDALRAQLAAVLAERDEARAEVAALVRQQLVDTRRSFEEVQP